MVFSGDCQGLDVWMCGALLAELPQLFQVLTLPGLAHIHTSILPHLHPGRPRPGCYGLILSEGVGYRKLLILFLLFFFFFF